MNSVPSRNEGVRINLDLREYKHQKLQQDVIGVLERAGLKYAVNEDSITVIADSPSRVVDVIAPALVEYHLSLSLAVINLDEA